MTTTVVIGLYRGGTSMICGVLRLLGMNMLIDSTAYNNEYTKLRDSPTNEERIEEVLRLNQEHEEWGFKDPGVLNYLDHIKPHLNQPDYIVIWRNPYDVVASEMHRANYKKKDAQRFVLDQVDKMQKFTGNNFCLEYTYENFLHKPSESIERLAKDLGVQYSMGLQEFNDRLSIARDFVSAKGYKRIDRYEERIANLGYTQEITKVKD